MAAPKDTNAKKRTTNATPDAGRVSITKTYKLFIGGAFPRSESGRTFEVRGTDGTFLANASLASRKDARDAVKAARGAFAKWSGMTAYLRGQILYRIAEMLEGRRDQFMSELRGGGMTPAAARREVDRAIDTWVYYAGFADKYAQVVGSANPVAAPYFNFSFPEPTGVVAVVAPQGSNPLWGLAATIAPAIVSGNTVVCIPDEGNPLPSITFAEVVASSDVPGGVINVLTGKVGEIAPILAGHMDVNAIDLAGAPAELAKDLETVSAENLKRVLRPRELDPRRDGDLTAITRTIELKTVWHPIGV